MHTVKVKTADLTSQALDWAVAKAEGKEVHVKGGGVFTIKEEECFCYGDGIYAPSEKWTQGGPLIDKHNVWLSSEGDMRIASCWPHANNSITKGDTPLVAACRAIVMNKLGDEVEVPAELVGGAP